jgi:putative transposase
MYMITPCRGHISLPLSPRGTPWRAPTDNIENFGQPVPGSLGSIIRQYKSSVMRKIVHQQGVVPYVWQRNYYEHIIRDKAEHNRIRL